MKITNSTPLLVGPFAGRTPANAPALCVVAKGSFSYADNAALVPLAEPLPFAADTFRNEDDPAGELLYEGDFAPWKPRADILLRGTCHTPGGKSLGSCHVRLDVGGWSKSLLVYGERRWSGPAAGPGVARPFTKQPLGWNAAFGGPGWARNPVGVGYGGTVLPPVEDERRLMKTAADTPVESGFGPLNRAWPQRAGKVGTYGGSYLKERWPGLPADFDWSYFNAAPEDQQLDGYLKGDEPIRLENLHEGVPLVRTVLPGWRVRAVVQHLVDRGRKVAVQELPLALDTLYVDTDARTLVLLWRGLMPIENGDMENVLEVLLHAEDLEARPMPLVALQAHLSPPAHLLPTTVPTAAPGAGAPAEKEKGGAAGKGPAAAQGPAAAGDAGAAPPPKAPAADAQADAAAPAGAGEAPETGGPPPAPPVTPRPANSPAVKALADVMAATQAERAAGLARLREHESTLEEMIREEGKPPWPGWPFEPQPAAMGTLRRQLAADAPPPGSPAEVPAEYDMARVDDTDVAQVDRALAGAGRADPPEKRPPTRAEVQAQGQQPDGLKQADLAGAALAGMDLAGSNMEGANLTGTDLSGGNLKGARLPHAQMAGAKLPQANLAGADLTGADLAGVDLSGADLRGAKLAWADLSGASLAGANLAGADANNATLAGADLSGARAGGVTLTDADLSNTRLDGADFAGAQATGARFSDAVGARVIFEKARLAGARFDGGGFEKGKFAGIDAPRSIWEGAFLVGADFSAAVLGEAFFEKANAEKARFPRADLAGARCRKARLVGAQVSDANLFRGSLEKADLTDADFSRSNLFEVEFLDATLKNTLFEGTNLTRTKLAAV